MNVVDRVTAKDLVLWHRGSKLVVDRKTPDGLYIPPAGEIRVRRNGEFLYVIVGLKVFELSIPAAVKVGMALAKNGGYALYHHLWITFAIDATELVLLPETAMRLGGAMLKKADRADDSQRRMAS